MSRRRDAAQWARGAVEAALPLQSARLRAQPMPSTTTAPPPPAGAHGRVRGASRRGTHRVSDAAAPTRLHALVVLSSAAQTRASAARRARSVRAVRPSRLHSVYIRAASEFAGELGFGSHSSDWMDVSTADTS